MKKLLRMLKHLNAFTNNHLTAKEEAEQILKFLVLKNNTIRSIEVFEALEVAMKFEMLKRESEAAATCRAVNVKWSCSTKKDYSLCEKPLKDIEVNYEILTPQQ